MDRTDKRRWHQYMVEHYMELVRYHEKEIKKMEAKPPGPKTYSR